MKAGDRQDRRLEEKGHEDLSGGRPERLEQPDLPHPLGHGDQHDVHDPDSGDRQRHRGDSRERRGEDRQDAGERAEDRILGHDRDVLDSVVPLGEDLEHPVPDRLHLLERVRLL